MNRYKLTLIILLVITVAIPVSVTACTKNGEETSEYHIDIISNGKVIDSPTLTELHTLPELTIVADGKTQTGPTLLSVLSMAGVQDFQSVTVKGLLKGRLAATEMELTRSEITEQVLLEFNNSGKTKLCGTEIPGDKWVVDVNTIVIN